MSLERLTAPQRVCLLVISANDYLPAPRSTRFFLEAESGAQPSKFVRCTVCKGCRRLCGDDPCVICLDAMRDGKPINRPRHGCRRCPLCDVNGMVRAHNNSEPFDAYSGMTISELRAAIDKDPRSTRSRPIPNGNGDTLELRWLRERERYRRAGDYDALERALAALKVVSPERFELLSIWQHTHREIRWSSIARRRVTVTLEVLATVMPTPIRVPPWVTSEYAARLSLPRRARGHGRPSRKGLCSR